MTEPDIIEVLVPADPAVIEVLVQDGPQIVEVLIPGETGPAGAAAQAYVHQQPSPLATWTVNHNLGLRPLVTVLSPGGIEVEAEIIHASANQALVLFNSPSAGSARCI